MIERRLFVTLAWLGGGLVALWGALVYRYPLASGLENPRAGWVDLVAPTFLNLGWHVGLYLGLTILYLLALRNLLAVGTFTRADADAQCQPVAHNLYALIIGVWLTSSLLLLFMVPSGESHDLFDYVFRGRMMTELDANPLAEVPMTYKDAPFYRYTAWKKHVDTYGPLWELSSAGVSFSTRAFLKLIGVWGDSLVSCPKTPLSCHMLMGYVTGYRLLAIGFTALSGWFIASMVGQNHLARTRPYLAAAALVAWLWNPLLLVATAVGAHNDALMIFLLLASFWLLQRQRWLTALLAFILAAHVKLTILVLAPVLGLWLVRQHGWIRAIGYSVASCVIGLGLSWLLYWPFDGWETLPRMLAERVLFRANSFWHLMYIVLQKEYEWPFATVWYLTVQLPTWLFVLSAIGYSFWGFDFRPRRWKMPTPPNWQDDRLLWRAATVVSLLYLLVGSFWFQHWYVVWALAPAVLLPDSRLPRGVLPWLCFGALSSNVVANFGPTMVPEGASRTGLYTLNVAMIWGPAMFYAFWQRGKKV